MDEQPVRLQLRSASTSSALPLATVSLKQFNPLVSGNIGTPRPGVSVTVSLARAGRVVAAARATTGARGGWAVRLRSIQGRLQAPGDDRDEILVRYGAHGPRLGLIQTGNGGNPFSAAGWTGWFDLDHGYGIGHHSVLLSPCSQTGVLGLRVGGRPTKPLIEQCQLETDVAVVRTKALRPGTALSLSSADNRAVTLENSSLPPGSRPARPISGRRAPAAPGSSRGRATRSPGGAGMRSGRRARTAPVRSPSAGSRAPAG